MHQKVIDVAVRVLDILYYTKSRNREAEPRGSEAEEENDENRFNPWILNNRLIEAGAFNRAADLRLWSINRIYPLDYLGQIPYSEEIMLNLCRMDYPFLITVTGVKDPRHFLAPYKLTGDDMIVIDPAAGKRCLSEFENICELRMFRPYKKSLLR